MAYNLVTSMRRDLPRTHARAECGAPWPVGGKDAQPSDPPPAACDAMRARDQNLRPPSNARARRAGLARAQSACDRRSQAPRERLGTQKERRRRQGPLGSAVVVVR